MKLMTLNTHSLVENNYQQKLVEFTDAVANELPDIIALQEVNQTAGEEAVEQRALTGYFSCCGNAVIRKDNHVFNVAKHLYDRGIVYYWTWLPIKLGYNRYDEGIALMSLSPISETKVITVSANDDYHSWKTRRILGIKTAVAPNEWFFSVHYGWWSDAEEPFQEEWKRTITGVPKAEKIWLMGDFNNPEQIRGEGYDMISDSGWYDSYAFAEKKDSGITVAEVIDGWKAKISSTDGMRIDQIWCSKNTDILSSEVVFNGKHYPVVSDHYGVMVKYERSK